MRPTEILTDEHRVIEQVLACLEKMANLCETQGRIEAQPARDALAFFRMFADRCHHGKEEAQLFPLMEARGYSSDSGPTAVMRQEHEQGRDLVRGIEESIEAASQGHAEGARLFIARSRDYIRLLREHIQKEDHCLFPMANQALSAEDQRSLLRHFEQVDGEDLGEGDRESYHRMANDLADHFGVPRARLQRKGVASDPGTSLAK